MASKEKPARTFAGIFHNPLTAWLVLAVSLLLTVMAWIISSAYAESRARDRFNFEVDKSTLAIAKRMEGYEQVLRGVVGLFNASDEVNRLDFKRYVSNLQIDTYWPGIQGIGYAEMLEPTELEAHQQKIRAQGFADYEIKPEGKRDVYSSIVYLEPFSGRNLRAFGYDMYSDPIRREAMQRAADTGKPALSSKVTLVQETQKDVQAGVLVYLPLYQQNMPLNSIENRRAALLGFVYSPFRINDLMQGILGLGIPFLDFRIYDGESIVAENLLYDSSVESGNSREPGRFSSERKLKLQGQTWTIVLFSHQGFDAQLESAQPSLVALGGLIVDILLFLVILSIARHHMSTKLQAANLTKALEDLQRSEQRMEHLAHHDALTGLPNRFLFKDRLNIAVARIKRSQGVVALLYIDLDEFKPINDNFGHDTGDKLLIEVGNRMSQKLRGEDTVARLGGDEFAVLIIGHDDVDEIIKFTERLLASIAHPYQINDKQITISASIGIALLPHHAETPDKLMICADKAMYQAKSAGRNIWHMPPVENVDLGTT